MEFLDIPGRRLVIIEVVNILTKTFGNDWDVLDQKGAVYDRSTNCVRVPVGMRDEPRHSSH